MIQNSFFFFFCVCVCVKAFFCSWSKKFGSCFLFQLINVCRVKKGGKKKRMKLNINVFDIYCNRLDKYWFKFWSFSILFKASDCLKFFLYYLGQYFLTFILYFYTNLKFCIVKKIKYPSHLLLFLSPFLLICSIFQLNILLFPTQCPYHFTF